MQDANADEKSAVLHRRETVKSELEYFLKIDLRLLSEHLCDYVNPETGTVYEFREDPMMGQSSQFLMEMFASANPEHFEKGWLYRYQAIDYLVYYNDKITRLYRYKALCQFFWDNFLQKTLSKEWKISVGARNNPWSVAVLIPSNTFDKFLKKIIPRGQAPAVTEEEIPEPEIPDETEL